MSEIYGPVHHVSSPINELDIAERLQIHKKRQETVRRGKRMSASYGAELSEDLVTSSGWTVFHQHYIASGSFGKVYVAVNQVTKQVAAAKIIAKAVLRSNKIPRQHGGSILSLENIRDEVRLQRKASQSNPFVARILDFTEENPQYVIIIMEKAKVDLQDWIEGASPTSGHDLARVNVAYQLIIGVYLMHKAGIVHRDIKPGNVLLFNDIDLEVVPVKFTDFGLACDATDQDCLHRMTVSRAFAPMEVQNPKGVAPDFNGWKAVDMWGLGALLHYVFYGWLPEANAGYFPRPFDDVVYTDADKAMWKPPTISSDLKNLLMSMMATEPQNRITFPEIFVHPAFKTFEEILAKANNPFLNVWKHG